MKRVLQSFILLEYLTRLVRVIHLKRPLLQHLTIITANPGSDLVYSGS